MRIPYIIPLALLLLGGCNRNGGEPATQAEPAVADTAPASATPGGETVTMRYACDGDTSVEVLGADKARASMPGGQVIELTKVADSSPPVYSGGSLYFAIGSTDAHLSQEDGTNELACAPQ